LYETARPTDEPHWRISDRRQPDRGNGAGVGEEQHVGRNLAAARASRDRRESRRRCSRRELPARSRRASRLPSGEYDRPTALPLWSNQRMIASVSRRLITRLQNTAPASSPQGALRFSGCCSTIVLRTQRRAPMPIRFTCPVRGREVQVRDEYAGRPGLLGLCLDLYRSSPGASGPGRRVAGHGQTSQPAPPHASRRSYRSRRRRRPRSRSTPPRRPPGGVPQQPSADRSAGRSSWPSTRCDWEGTAGAPCGGCGPALDRDAHSPADGVPHDSCEDGPDPRAGDGGPVPPSHILQGRAYATHRRRADRKHLPGERSASESSSAS
jgi:hypothetical protein